MSNAVQDHAGIQRLVQVAERSQFLSRIDFLIRLPSVLLNSSIACVIGAILALILYTVKCIGYPRPFYTHSSFNVEAYLPELHMRIVSRLKAICNCKESTHDIQSSINSAFPTEAITPESISAYTVDVLLQSMLNGRGVKHDIVTPFSQPTSSVMEVIRPLQIDYIQDVREGRLSDVSKGLCAIADLRLLVASVFPAVSQMHIERTKKMSFVECVRYHTNTDLKTFSKAITELYKAAHDKHESATSISLSILNSIDEKCVILMTGRETFIGKLIKKLSKVIVAPFKIVIDLTRLLITIVKSIGPIVKTFSSLISLFLGDVVELVTATLMAVRYVLSELRTGIVPGTTALARVAIGFVGKVTITLTRSILLWSLTVIGTYGPATIAATMLTVVYVPLLVVKVLIGTVDFVSDGSVRFIGRTDNHPEAWWRISGHELGNKHQRNIVSFTPCVPGYKPSGRGMFCSKDTKGVPHSSPSALLMRKYVLGKYGQIYNWITTSDLPSNDPRANAQFTRRKATHYANIYESEHAPLIRDMIMLLVLCRKSIFNAGAKCDTIAFHAVDKNIEDWKDVYGPRNAPVVDNGSVEDPMYLILYSGAFLTAAVVMALGKQITWIGRSTSINHKGM